jgi:outer membrane biosynthesis protein TonB
MNLKISFFFSIVLYNCIFLFAYAFIPNLEETNQIKIQKGATGLISFVFVNRNEGVNQDLQTEKSLSIEGTLTEEIDKLRNKISYPVQALEDGLESECEWSVVIDKNQKATQVKTIHACKYKIFEEEFQRVIKDWNFTLPENTILQIPVSFKIR